MPFITSFTALFYYDFALLQKKIIILTKINDASAITNSVIAVNLYPTYSTPITYKFFSNIKYTSNEYSGVLINHQDYDVQAPIDQECSSNIVFRTDILVRLIILWVS